MKRLFRINPIRVFRSSVDPDAQAFITAAGITNPTQQSAIIQLVINLKGYGLWSKMKAVYPMVGDTSTSCKYNLINPADTDAAFRIVFSAGWTFSSSGATPTLNAYADTKILPTSVLSISSAHLATYVNTTPNNGVLMGNNSLSCFLQINSGLLLGNLGGLVYAQATTSHTSGFYSVNRSPGSSSIQLIKNGIVIADTTSSQHSYSNAQNIFLGNYNTGSSFPSNARIAFSSIGDGLSNTDVSNLYTAVQAFQTTLGRQV